MTDVRQHVPAKSAAPHHRLSVAGRTGALDLLFEAEFTSPWTVLFGPSGCGKSTILRALCGLADHLRVDLSRMSSGAHREILEDKNTAVPPEKRKLAYAPQHAVLFPHLNVLENVRFGDAVRARGASPDSLVREAMELFALEPLAKRLPRQLSGGERQRVSLARALAVPNARLILLDEPFAGVDRALRDDLLPRIKDWLGHRNLPAISVTHDVDEALLCAADVVRLEDGRVTAQGPAPNVLADEVERMLRAVSPVR